MILMRQSTIRFRVISVAAAATAIWAASSIAYAAPKKTAPSPTLSANSDEDEEAPDPSKIVLPGTVITRPGDKGYLSLSLEGGSWKLAFFDKNKKAVAPDVARATARWKPKQTHGMENALLSPGPDGQSLKALKFTEPPFPLQVFITLLNDQDVGVENYTVTFKP